MRTTTSFKLAIGSFSIGSIRKTIISDHCDKLAFSLNKKFTDDVIFSHAETLTGCPLDANNITFRGYRRVILLLSAPYVTRDLGRDEHGLFVVDGDLFYRMYQVCMWSCSLDLLLLPGLWPTHPSAVAYCNALIGLSQAPTREP